MSHTVVLPEGWPRPKGYANGVVAAGRTLYVAGQIGWDKEGVFAADDLVGQFGQALDNVLAIVLAAGGQPSDVVNMTIYVTDVEEYRRCGRDLGPLWRQRFGRHYPAMALVAVAALVEPRAKVEIQAVASLPEDTAR
jgi:enamine deaminase RidA (YjgF/YER057c/UK114 family)